MHKHLTIFVIFCCALFLAGAVYVQRLPKPNLADFSPAAADVSQSPYAELSKAKVLEVLKTESENTKHYSRFYQELKVKIISGSEKGKEALVIYDDQLLKNERQAVKAGQTIVVGKIQAGDEAEYVMADRYRLPALIILVGLFFISVLIFGKWRGLTSIFGLIVSIAVLVYFIAPNILAGKSPLLVTLTGGGVIAFASMFFAHGFNKRTLIALVSLLSTLTLASVIAYVFVNSAWLLGVGTEGAYFLQTGFFGNLNLQGLLLGGILIGALGVLDDITTAQTAVVEELFKVNNQLSLREVFFKANSVGKEHIASLVNTLVLAYAGASMPIFLLFNLQSNISLWTLLNSEFVAEEIVRTLVGSTALVLAVPITTALAAYYFSKSQQSLRNSTLPKT